VASTRMRQPPPVLDHCRVVEYAVLAGKVTYSGHSNLFFDGREVGPVAALAIGKPTDDQEPLLLHCDRKWAVEAVAGYPTVKEAKTRAEKIYPGVSALWRRTGVSKAKADAYLARMWKGMTCSFCGRRPDQVKTLIGIKPRICDICVREFHEGIDDIQSRP